MYCTQCGKKIPDNSKFCQYCGSAVESDSEEYYRKVPVGQVRIKKIPDNHDLFGQIPENALLRWISMIGIIVYGIQAVYGIINIITGCIWTSVSENLLGDFSFLAFVTGINYFILIRMAIVTVASAGMALNLWFVYKKREDYSPRSAEFIAGIFGIILAVENVILIWVSMQTYSRSALFMNIVMLVFSIAVPVIMYFVFSENDPNFIRGTDFWEDVKSSFKSFSSQLSSGDDDPEMKTVKEAIVEGRPLNTKRGFVGFFLLNLITCGIYRYFFFHGLARDINIACDGDGSHTNGVLKLILFSLLTCGIYAVIWYYAVEDRLEKYGKMHNLAISESGVVILLCLLLGGWCFGIGNYIADYIIIKNTNIVCREYNETMHIIEL